MAMILYADAVPAAGTSNVGSHPPPPPPPSASFSQRREDGPGRLQPTVGRQDDRHRGRGRPPGAPHLLRRLGHGGDQRVVRRR